MVQVEMSVQDLRAGHVARFNLSFRPRSLSVGQFDAFVVNDVPIVKQMEKEPRHAPEKRGVRTLVHFVNLSLAGSVSASVCFPPIADTRING